MKSRLLGLLTATALSVADRSDGAGAGNPARQSVRWRGAVRDTGQDQRDRRADGGRGDQRRGRRQRQEAQDRLLRHRRQARAGGGRRAQACRRRQGDGDHRAVQLRRVPRGISGRRASRRRDDVDGLVGAEACRAVHLRPAQYVGRRLHVPQRDEDAAGQEVPDRDRRDRLRHRRRHLQDHGRDRAAEYHEGGRYRDEGVGHVPDPGLRSCGAGVATEGDTDRPDRRRIGTGCRDPSGAGATAARSQGTAGGRLHHRRFRACDPHGRERQRHRDSDDVLRRRQRQGEDSSRPSSSSAPRPPASIAPALRNSTPPPTTSCCSMRMR